MARTDLNDTDRPFTAQAQDADQALALLNDAWSYFGTVAEPRAANVNAGPKKTA